MLAIHMLAADQPQNWFYSTGFGGTMAVLAACLALGGVLIASGRARDSSESELEHERRKAALDRCWQQFVWLSGNQQLPVRLRFAILKRLGETTAREKDTVMAQVLSNYGNALAVELRQQGPGEEVQ